MLIAVESIIIHVHNRSMKKYKIQLFIFVCNSCNEWRIVAVDILVYSMGVQGLFRTKKLAQYLSLDYKSIIIEWLQTNRPDDESGKVLFHQFFFQEFWL